MTKERKYKQGEIYPLFQDLMEPLPETLPRFPGGWQEAAAYAERYTHRKKVATRYDRFINTTFFEYAVPVPNLAAKSFLFKAIANGKRPFQREFTPVAVMAPSEISLAFMGEQFDQADLTLWMVFLSMAHENEDGELEVSFMAKRLLSKLRKEGTSKDYKWLERAILRLTATQIRFGIKIENDFEPYMWGPLVNNPVFEKNRNMYRLCLDKRLKAFLFADDFSFVNLEQRLKLKNSQLAQSFMLYLLSHQSPHSIGKDKLFDFWGVDWKDKEKNKSKFIWMFKERAISPLVEIGFLRNCKEEKNHFTFIWSITPNKETIEIDGQTEGGKVSK